MLIKKEKRSRDVRLGALVVQTEQLSEVLVSYGSDSWLGLFAISCPCTSERQLSHIMLSFQEAFLPKNLYQFLYPVSKL